MKCFLLYSANKFFNGYYIVTLLNDFINSINNECLDSFRCDSTRKIIDNLEGSFLKVVINCSKLDADDSINVIVYSLMIAIA